MAKPNRTPAQARIAKSQAIRRDRRERAQREPVAKSTASRSEQDLLAACVAAGGFDQNDAYAS